MQIVDNHTQVWDELMMLMLSSGGRFELDSNRVTHRHCLFIELQNGEFSRTFVFANRHDILRLIGSDEFQNMLTLLDSDEYLINIQPRNDDE